MKRLGKLFAVLMLFALLTVGCNKYVCPAYSSDTVTEQQDAERS